MPVTITITISDNAAAYPHQHLREIADVISDAVTEQRTSGYDPGILIPGILIPGDEYTGSLDDHYTRHLTPVPVHDDDVPLTANHPRPVR